MPKKNVRDLPITNKDNIANTGIYNKSAIIAVDFDRTCVKCAYPYTHGSIGAEDVLRELLDSGHRLVLWTLRGEIQLEAAIDWFKYHNLELVAVNDNAKISPFGYSRKINHDLLIDDIALGIPTIVDDTCKYPYVDWVKVRALLIERNLIK